MRTVLLLAALVIAPPAWAVPLTWEFTGGQAYMSVSGSFTYESTATPDAYNVHHLATNVTYALTSWDLTVTNTFASIPHPSLVDFPSSMTFSNLLPGNTSEFCLGVCIFSSQPYETLRFNDGEYFMQLAFEIPSSVLFLGAPPDTLEEWGTFAGGLRGASSFESSRIISVMMSGALTGEGISPLARVPEPIPQSVPEASSLWLLLAAMGLVSIPVALSRR